MSYPRFRFQLAAKYNCLVSILCYDYPLRGPHWHVFRYWELMKSLEDPNLYFHTINPIDEIK